MTIPRRLMSALLVMAAVAPAFAQDHAAHRAQPTPHHAEEAQQIEQWLAEYDAAFNAKDLARRLRGLQFFLKARMGERTIDSGGLGSCS